ncbi:MAG: class I SAM-dependent methyltransferase [bacterium]|nr:class I SAM-dependent methyltransferase [bacterium]
MAYDLSQEVVKNFLMGIPAVRRWRARSPRAFSDSGSVSDILSRNAFLGLNLLLDHVGDLRERSVCEIGAGDYLTSGLSILAAGASRYGVIDRFPGDYTGEAAKHWYREIQRNWDGFYPSIPWDETLSAEDFPEEYKSRVELIRQSLEAAVTESRFDIICSFQVGEHVTDLDAFAEIHQRLLEPGGVGLHRVDFGPHDVWFSYRDPTTFLRFSDFTWRLTGSNRGAPNRRRHHEFLEAFKRAGLEVELLLLEHFDETTIEFTRLNRTFLKMPRESLLVGTAVYRLSIVS